MDDEENALWRGFEARLERLEHLVQELLDLVNGNRHRKIVGLSSEQDRMDLELRKINAVLFQDSTGQKGLLHDIDYLMGRKSDREKNRQYRWQFWTAVIVAMITGATALITNWDKIKKNFPKSNPGPLEARIERARHPKSPKKVYRLRVVPPSSAITTETEPKTPPEPEAQLK